MAQDMQLNQLLKEMWRIEENIELGKDLTLAEEEFYNQNLSIIQEYYTNNRENLIMEVKGYKQLYYFMQDGKEFSVWWTDETIKGFLPNWSVSEYMDHHLWNYTSIFCRCKYFWDKNLHPYWTTEDKERFKGGRIVPLPLNQQYVRDSARWWLKNAYEQFTKPLEFVVVNLHS
jgi:hypothetical protein